MERNISIIRNTDGHKIVLINEIRFKGKRSINWEEVREYCLHKLNRLYSVKVFKERFGQPHYRYVLINKTTGKPVRKQEGFLIETYFIHPRFSTCICFGDYL